MLKVEELLDSYILAEKLNEDYCSYNYRSQDIGVNFFRNPKATIRGIGQLEFSVIYDKECKITMYFNGDPHKRFKFSIANLCNYYDKEKNYIDFRQVGRHYFFGFNDYDSFLDFFSYYVNELDVYSRKPTFSQ